MLSKNNALTYEKRIAHSV